MTRLRSAVDCDGAYPNRGGKELGWALFFCIAIIAIVAALAVVGARGAAPRED